MDEITQLNIFYYGPVREEVGRFLVNRALFYPVLPALGYVNLN
jgi:hypothetical protein